LAVLKCVKIREFYQFFKIRKMRILDRGVGPLPTYTLSPLGRDLGRGCALSTSPSKKIDFGS